MELVNSLLCAESPIADKLRHRNGAEERLASKNDLGSDKSLSARACSLVDIKVVW